MVEKYPVISDGRVKFLISSSTEFTLLVHPNGGRELYLWLGEKACKLNWDFRKPYSFDGWFIEFPKWVEDTPFLFDWYSFENLEDYVRALAREYGRFLEGKRVFLSFSGGKDSTACLVILRELQEYVDFTLDVCYVHMPYLEDKENIDEAIKIADKLGFRVEVIEPPRWLMEKYLQKEGLPYRGRRWCTYLKTKVLKRFKRKVGSQIEVKGERLSEGGKRFSRFLAYLSKGTLVDGGQFRPAVHFTVLDVVKICREYGVVHYLYLKGCPRVSCAFCPYKSVFEFKIHRNVEDPGFIESVLKREYDRWYKQYVSFYDFMEYHLWRYTPGVAKMFTVLREKCSEITDKSQCLTIADVVKMYTSVWVEQLPKAPVIDFEKLSNLVKNTPLTTCVEHVEA